VRLTLKNDEGQRKTTPPRCAGPKRAQRGEIAILTMPNDTDDPQKGKKSSGSGGQPAQGPKAEYNPSVEEQDQAAIDALAAMSPLAYERSRRKHAQRLNLRVESLDRLVRMARARQKSAQESAACLGFENPEPWPRQVNGPDLVLKLFATIRRFLVISDEAAVAIALWVIHTHCYRLFEFSPILSVRSPDMRCGKSLLLELIGALVPRMLGFDNASAAALFRMIEKCSPVLLLDEWDSMGHEGREAVRNILNSGFKRSGGVLRCVGDGHEPKLFKTYCPKVVSGIGELPSTAADRAITIQLDRRLRHEEVERFRKFDGTTLRRKIARWISDNSDALRETQAALPDWMNDREQDIWEPLLAIADQCGWGEEARWSAQLLCTVENRESLNIELLKDVRGFFAKQEQDTVSTDTLLEYLNGLEDRPWPTSCHERKMHARRLADMLQPFGIAPKSVRIGPRTPKGYERGWFEDVFNRYLQPLVDDPGPNEEEAL
jgi:putative DNA primase/helicase